MTPDASNRATTKDILRHDWLAHGPVLSLRLNSTTPPPPPISSSSLSLADQQPQKDYEKVRLRTPTTLNDKSLSPANSLVELELHSSAFFDTAKLRENHSQINREQQRRNRASAIPDSTRYYTSNDTKSSSRSTSRRPLSLSLDDPHSHSPIDYHFVSTSEKPSQISPPSSQPYTRRSRRTVSPTSTKTTTTTTAYGNHDRNHSPPANQRYTLATAPETTRRTTSPINPSRYLVSYDFDTTLRDLKRKPIYKYTPPVIPPTGELNVVPSLLNSTTPIAPSVFTTSAIKFAPPPTRRMIPFKDSEMNSISTARLLNNTITNPSSNLDDSINSATTNHNHRRSFLTSYDFPSTLNNIRKSRLLDDNNNLISLKVHD